MRHEAVRFIEEQISLPSPCCAMPPRVVTDAGGSGSARKTRGELAPRLRGRPCREVTCTERVTVATLLDETGPRLGLPTLEACCSDVPRCAYSRTCSQIIAGNSSGPSTGGRDITLALPRLGLGD